MKVKGILKNSPVNVSFLANEKNHAAPPTPIKLVFDTKTFGTVCTTHVPQQYYDDYVMTTTFSETMQKLQASQAETLAKHCKNPKAMVEIGCGDGSFLKHCSKHFKRVVGIEPSVKFGEEARKAGFKVVCGYVSSQSTLFKRRFDAFASRQVFEHLEDPLDVLLGTKYMLNDGAVGLIEVPNGYRALRNGRFYEFFPDHIQYYSVNKLVELATKAGFNVISCNESFGGDYLELWVRWEAYPAIHLAEMAKTQSKVAKTVERFLNTYAQVAVFGAGAKTLSILATLKEETLNKIVCVIDDDPHKWNKFVPNSKVPVVGTSYAPAFAPQNVIIMALSYVDEIAAKVRKNLLHVQVFTIKNNTIVKVL